MLDEARHQDDLETQALALDDADRVDARAVRAALPGAVDRGARPTVP